MAHVREGILYSRSMVKVYCARESKFDSWNSERANSLWVSLKALLFSFLLVFLFYRPFFNGNSLTEARTLLNCERAEKGEKNVFVTFLSFYLPSISFPSVLLQVLLSKGKTFGCRANHYLVVSQCFYILIFLQESVLLINHSFLQFGNMTI